VTTEEGVEPSREYLRDRARADPRLTPAERETTLTIAHDRDTARVFSEEAAVVRRLLAHDGFEPERVGVHDGDTTRAVSFDEAVAETAPDDLVVRVQGALPVRYITIATVGRNHDEHAPIVSKEVFGE
jgi:hypothetical protein